MPGRRTKSKAPKRDYAQEAVDAIIEALDRDEVPPWRCPWASFVGLPKRSTMEPYQGVNLIVLMAKAAREGWISPYWFTYKQAEEMDAQVKPGSKSTLVCYYGSAKPKDDDPRGRDGEPIRRKFLKWYPVFNAAQIRGLPDRYDVSLPATPDLDYGSNDIPEAVSAYFEAIPALVEHGGARACYRRLADRINLPEPSTFAKRSLYWATRAHETIHWSGAPHRLNRKKGETFGDSAYAYEELVAELGSAILGAQLGLPSDHVESHAGYIDDWISALQNDRTFLFKAAGEAQQAADYLNEYQTGTEAEPLPMAA